MILRGYWRSTSSYRVRIGLALKGLEVKDWPVNLLAGEQALPDYLTINPQGRVPSLILESGLVLTQSAAILEYLEELVPEPPFLPRDLVARARVRAVASVIGSDIHPLHNVSALQHLRTTLQQSESVVSAWIARWIGEGLEAVERLIDGASFCFGEEPSLADIYLVPQAYAARRFAVPLEHLTKLTRVLAHAEAHPAFHRAVPERQTDAPRADSSFKHAG